MKTQSSVGKSHRTPIKHGILNALLGREAGIFRNGYWSGGASPDPEWKIIDTCAGDGEGVDGGASSPYIILKHASHVIDGGINEASVTLCELNSNTYGRLCANVDEWGWSAPTELKNMDCSELEFTPNSDKQAVFVNCDPNTIANMPIREKLHGSLTECTTMMVTLGCNVAGLKRIPREQREQWFTWIQMFIDDVPNRHDAVLVELVGDSSQWAYFLRIPRRWSGESLVNLCKGVNKKLRKHGLSRSLRLASFRCRSEWDDMTRRLFLTKDEVICE